MLSLDYFSKAIDEGVPSPTVSRQGLLERQHLVRDSW